MKSVFLTYATPNFAVNANRLAASAQAVGFDECLILGPDHLSGSDFYRQNEKILSQKRGGGYWLWKPHIILQALERLGPDDVLFYCDAGRNSYYEFTRFPSRLVSLAKSNEQGFLLGPEIPHLGAISQWTKRDCLILMGADDEAIWRRAPLQTSLSIWTNNKVAMDFLKIWLSYCEDERCLTDLPNQCGAPNLPDFKDHRHDQAILSIMAHQLNAPHLDFADSLVHKLISVRPYSALGTTFYKRPQNLDDLLGFDNPYILAREFFRLRRAS